MDPMIFDAALTLKGREQCRALHSKIIKIAPTLIITSPLTRALETTLLAVCVAGDGAATEEEGEEEGEKEAEEKGEEEQPKVTKPQIFCWPELTERMSASCDIGIMKNDLMGKKMMKKLLETWNMDMSNVPVHQPWWFMDQSVKEIQSLVTTKDIQQFYQLRGMREETILECMERVHIVLQKLRAAYDEAAAAASSSSPSIMLVGHGDFFSLLIQAVTGEKEAIWMENAEVMKVEVGHFEKQ
jgi:broad specificity phosphatase PhoE